MGLTTDGPHEDIRAWLARVFAPVMLRSTSATPCVEPSGVTHVPSSGRGGAWTEGVGDLESGVGHPGVVSAGDVLPVDGGGDAVVQSSDVRDVAAADLVPPEPRDQHRPLLERVRPLHILCYRLLRGRRRDRVRARRRAELREARRGHDDGQEEQRRRSRQLPRHAGRGRWMDVRG
jgi:hypothetical protein